MLPRGMPDGDGTKNVYSQGRFPKRISLRPSRAPRCAKRETEGDLPFLLLFRATAKAREVPQRTVHGVSPIRGYSGSCPSWTWCRRTTRASGTSPRTCGRTTAPRSTWSSRWTPWRTRPTSTRSRNPPTTWAGLRGRVRLRGLGRPRPDLRLDAHLHLRGRLRGLGLAVARLGLRFRPAVRPARLGRRGRLGLHRLVRVRLRHGGLGSWAVRGELRVQQAGPQRGQVSRRARRGPGDRLADCGGGGRPAQPAWRFIAP